MCVRVLLNMQECPKKWGKINFFAPGSLFAVCKHTVKAGLAATLVALCRVMAHGKEDAPLLCVAHGKEEMSLPSVCTR